MHVGISRSSLSFAILAAVIKRGGVITLHEVRLLPEVKAAQYREAARAIAFLSDTGVAMSDGQSLTATLVGKNFMADYLATQSKAPEKYVGQIVPPRTALPQSPELKKFKAAQAGRVVRPGSEDWKAIPSRMGAELRTRG